MSPRFSRPRKNDPAADITTDPLFKERESHGGMMPNPNLTFMGGSGTKSSRRMGLAIKVSACASPFLAVGWVISLLLGSHNTAPVTETYAASATNRAVARQGLDTWLNSEPKPILGAQVEEWESETQIPIPKAAAGASQDGPTSMAVETFSVNSSTTHQLYTVQVTVANTAAGASIVGVPAVNPVQAQADPLDYNSLWNGAATSTTTPALNTAATTWAQAYLSGDPTQLAQAVGDPVNGHVYQPLVGWKFLNATVNRVATVGASKTQASDQLGKTAIANLTVSYATGEQTNSSSDSTAQMSMDVLVDSANTAAPHIVAWGASGTGLQLREWQNAITAGQVNLSTPQPQASTGTGSAPASASASASSTPAPTATQPTTQHSSSKPSSKPAGKKK